MLDLKTKMGDDRLRFGGTNFIPGVSSDGGLYVNKWTPRLEFSGPLVKGRAWFHNGFDAFYSVDSVHGLPQRAEPDQRPDRQRPLALPGEPDAGQYPDRAASYKPGRQQPQRAELPESERRPPPTAGRRIYMSTLRDQHYFGGALLDVGFADTRGLLRNPPQGDMLYEITPSGNRGNYFSGVEPALVPAAVRSPTCFCRRCICTASTT